MATDTHRLTISYSMAKAWKRCRLKFYLKYTEGYVEPSGPGLRRGTCGHNALQKWYTGGDPEIIFEEAVEQLTELAKPESVTDQEIDELVDALVRYFDWSGQHEKFAKPEEYKFEYKFDLPLVSEDIRIQGYIDGVMPYNGKIWLLENKFQKRVSTQGLEFDAQSALYLRAARMCGIPAEGVLYNMVRVGTKKAIEEPVVRVPLTHTEAGLDVIWQEACDIATDIAEYEMFGGSVYRNTHKDCYWDCGFLRACQMLQYSGDPTSVLQNFERKEVTNDGPAAKDREA